MQSNLPLRALKKMLPSLAIFLFAGLSSRAQVDAEVLASLSGYNQDVIADPVLNTDPNTLVTSSIDNPPGYAFFAQGYSNNSTAYTNGLPDNGLLTTPTGRHYLLASYAGKNDLRLPQNTSGTLVFAAADQKKYDSLFILGTAGSGNAQVNYTIYFSDLTSQSGSFTLADWFCSSCTQYAVNGLDRVNLSLQGPDLNPNFDIYENKIILAGGKTVDSIAFNVPNNNGFANIFGITGYIPSALPVNLVSYNVTLDNGKALLQWKTAQELNSSQYIIERANNLNPNHFVQIGAVAATAAPNGSSYSFTDNPGVSGTYFYQLLEKDIDGRIQVLGTRSITISSNTTWAVQDLGNQWRLISAQPFKYRLIDMQGRVLGGATGSGTVLITKPEAPGIYELQVQAGGFFSAKKLIK